MTADLMMDIMSSNSDRKVSSPEKFSNVGPFRSFPHSPCPPPQTKFLDPPPAGPTFNLTHVTPLGVTRASRNLFHCERHSLATIIVDGDCRMTNSLRALPLSLSQCDYCVINSLKLMTAGKKEDKLLTQLYFLIEPRDGSSRH